ncbi:hypothetical protein Lnau_1321 [Legionella nautarum]|uniref:Uncharacterized protein n=1 Tax=Legionella nautarum TaxID=45070 RepID=A0A0W0WVL0_9GAMM|nr:phage holin family protein [Legionella nautarum]KTD36337.1 hypothetical protein Lnau_1321 [Legionella nautarum]
MFFFTRLQIPRFSSTSYEALIEETLLTRGMIEGNNHKYKALLKLKRHAIDMAASFHQLSGVSTNSSNIGPLQDLIQEAISATLSAKAVNPQEIRERLNLLKVELSSEQGRKLVSALFMFTNFFLTTVAVLGVVFFSAAMLTSPLGIALVAACMTIVSTAVLLAATYSLYVDGRNLFDKQIKEIESGIDFLLDEYPVLVAQDPEAYDYVPQCN